MPPVTGRWPCNLACDRFKPTRRTGNLERYWKRIRDRPHDCLLPCPAHRRRRCTSNATSGADSVAASQNFFSRTKADISGHFPLASIDISSPGNRHAIPFHDFPNASFSALPRIRRPNHTRRNQRRNVGRVRVVYQFVVTRFSGSRNHRLKAVTTNQAETLPGERNCQCNP